MADIAQEFQCNYRKFEATAKDWTERFAAQVRTYKLFEMFLFQLYYRICCVYFRALLYLGCLPWVIELNWENILFVKATQQPLATSFKRVAPNSCRGKCVSVILKCQKASRPGMHNSDFMAGQKMLLKHLRARLVSCFLNFCSVSIKNQAKYSRCKFGLCGPD